MKCPNCNSLQTFKNGHRKDRQCYKCKQCGRQFLEYYRPWSYSEVTRQRCIKMYMQGMGLRKIEQISNVHHTTVLRWIQKTENRSNAADLETGRSVLPITERSANQ